VFVAAVWADAEQRTGRRELDLPLPPEARRMKRGHTDGPRPVKLPERWLELIDDPTPPAGAEVLVSGG
jgi:hypothetical protein